MPGPLDRTKIPEDGQIYIKRDGKFTDGKATFSVYGARISKVAGFECFMVASKRFYKTSDGEVHSTAEAAADHALKLKQLNR